MGIVPCTQLPDTRSWHNSSPCAEAPSDVAAHDVPLSCRCTRRSSEILNITLEIISTASSSRKTSPIRRPSLCEKKYLSLPLSTKYLLPSSRSAKSVFALLAYARLLFFTCCSKPHVCFHLNSRKKGDILHTTRTSAAPPTIFCTRTCSYTIAGERSFRNTTRV